MQNNTENQVYAGFFVRLAAYIIDWIIVGCVLLVVKFPLWIATVASPDNFIVKDFIFSYSVKDIVLYLLGVLYFILLTYFTGATLGKRAMRLRVVSSEQRKMTLFEVAYRETVGRFLSKIIIFIGYFMIGPDRENVHCMIGWRIRESYITMCVRSRSHQRLFIAKAHRSTPMVRCRVRWSMSKNLIFEIKN